MSPANRAATLWAALACVAFVAPARAQTADQDEPVYQYGTPEGGLGVYADTVGHKVGVTILSGHSENHGAFAASRVMAWLGADMKGSLTDGPSDDLVSLVLVRQSACVLRLSETAHADHEITIPCGQLPILTQGMVIAAGQMPIYFDYQVDKQAATIPGSPTPTYPLATREEGITGTVLVQFVVDTNGRADMHTFKVLKSAHEELSEAVRHDLPDMRFTPAVKGGHKVEQLVQEPFGFYICGQPAPPEMVAHCPRR
jgi:TonB family protein